MNRIIPKLTRRVPKYSLHKTSGQALIKLGGKTFYLGKYGTKTSRCKYEKLVGQWIANGRKLPGEEMRPICLPRSVLPGSYHINQHSPPDRKKDITERIGSRIAESRQRAVGLFLQRVESSSYSPRSRKRPKKKNRV